MSLLQHSAFFLSLLIASACYPDKPANNPEEPLRHEEHEEFPEDSSGEHKESDTGDFREETPTDTPPPKEKTKQVDESIQDTESKSTQAFEYSRNNPSPRAQFAKDDLKILKSLFYGDGDKDLPKGFKKLAEVFHYDGFRAIPEKSLAPVQSEHRILLLGYSLEHIKETINFLAGLAKSISEEGVEARTKSLRNINPVPLASLVKIKAAAGISVSDFNKIELQIDEAYSSFIKEMPLSEKMGKFWPEATQLEITFGTDRVLFIFPSVMTFKAVITSDLLEGKTLFQTPWILRALEGDVIHAVWQCVSVSESGQTNQQMGNRKELLKFVRNYLFESIWDERSTFFPSESTFRVIGRFYEPIRDFPGSEYFGHRRLECATVDQFMSKIADLVKSPGFTFKNTPNLPKEN